MTFYRWIPNNIAFKMKGGTKFTAKYMLGIYTLIHCHTIHRITKKMGRIHGNHQCYCRRFNPMELDGGSQRGAIIEGNRSGDRGRKSKW